MVKSWPMLAVPRWLEIARVPKEHMVVSALKRIARGVLVVMTSAMESALRSRNTR